MKELLNSFYLNGHTLGFQSEVKHELNLSLILLF